jgi:Tol biopolymer transport system component/predicted Ser/Thr protein kinase
MPLATGTRLGPYEIVAPIGKGGMGEVYRARDTRLGRDVAIKVSAEKFSERFEREARVIASLNHPNVCQLYDVGDNYLVMELIDGAPLKGPLPLEKTVEYAGQILDALDAAHQKGITHRDLKPDNILVTKQGIKLLDFGLAKQQSSAIKESDTTLTQALTSQGQIVGTWQYLSPEQLQGKEADARSDLFSFGCVLYELLTGKRAFEGKSAASLIAAILEREPAPLEVARPLDRIVRRSLAKDPDQRFQTARDLKAALSWVLDQPPSSPARQGGDKWLWPALVSALALALIALGALFWRATRPVDRPLTRLDVDLGPEAVAGQFTTAVISPDGSRLVFPAKSPDGKPVLATRLLSEAKPSLLAGTDSARDPFFSPDGKWIGFFAGLQMKKISVQGGAPVVLCDLTLATARGADWGDAGNIVAALSSNGVLSRISAEGGVPQQVTKLQGNAGLHRWPQFLPGSEAVLFTAAGQSFFGNTSIAAAFLKTGETKILVRDGYFGRYLPTSDTTGHLVYVHQGALFAVPFDPARLELRGTAVPILDDVAADPGSGAGQFSFSGPSSGSARVLSNEPGAFVYRTGKVPMPSWPVWWLDSPGKTKPLIATPGLFICPRFSPDGQRLAIAQVTESNQALFVYDLRRDTMTRLAFNTQVPRYPVWSPDGRHIAFAFSSADGFSIGWTRADGSGEVQHLLDSKRAVAPYSFFPDGRRLAYQELDPTGGFDIWTMALDVSDPDRPKSGNPEPFLRTPSGGLRPAVSPDGRWIAYQSTETGSLGTYVRPFPGPGGKWQIFPGGISSFPVWSRTSRELFFQNSDRRIMVVDYEPTNDSFGPGKPRLWSDQQLSVNAGGYPNFDLAPDGKRFAIFPDQKALAEEKGNVRVTFLLNFFDELRRRAPVAGK